jgi:hypothetical protein
MSIARLLNYPITLIERVSDVEDSWGSPTFTEAKVLTECYYRQLEMSDDGVDTEANPSVSVEVFLHANLKVSQLDRVELDMGQGPESYEVVGQPAPELNGRLGTVNHLRMVVRRALP